MNNNIAIICVPTFSRYSAGTINEKAARSRLVLLFFPRALRAGAQFPAYKKVKLKLGTRDLRQTTDAKPRRVGI
jgi:hypothetical protein